MEKKIKLTVDGKEIEARPDQTILEAIQGHRLAEIPTLCHDPKLPLYGSCYLCVVQVEGVNKLIPSCSSPVAPGMVVHTDNETIRQARKSALELLLSNHYADCRAPCQQTCPAGVDVQGYIALMAAGRFSEAVRLIKQTNPLPLVCGRVCVRECEVTCRRNRVDERVGIDYLKRYATDIDIQNPWTPELPPASGKRVAVVGGGPAGLTCAYYLRLQGHGVTLFEKAPRLGGMLRYGIPEYRLPKAMLDKEINWIIGLGVEVHTHSALGKDLSLETLKKKGFDAVFLAFGAQKAKAMRLPEEDKIVGVLPGIDFLWQVESPEKPKIYGRVVVVGGGNTAIDAARTAVRLGADNVILLYRRTRQEMPAHQMEIDAALHEGVELIELAAPTRLISDQGRLKGLECIRMRLGEPDASGRRSPVPIPGSEYTLDCDFAVSAIGQDVDLCGLNTHPQLKSTRQNTLVFDPQTFATGLAGVFTGGDMATGPAIAIDAIAHGRQAAATIGRYLKNGELTPGRGEFLSRKEVFGDLPDAEFAHYSRLKKEAMPELPPRERAKDFREVELGFTPEQAASESRRCLECGCSAYFDCDLRRLASQFQVSLDGFSGEVRRYKVDPAHPFIGLDPNKCIACGRCVRTCSEILRVSALGFVYRGFRTVVKPSLEKKLLETNCISCGNCIAACPTGAIFEKLPFPKPGPWAGTTVRSVCNFCSVGCNLNYKIFGDQLFTVANCDGDTHNLGYLCLKGRFGQRIALDKERLLTPLLRRDVPVPGEAAVAAHQPVAWEEALTEAGRRLTDIIKKHGPETVAVFASPRLSNEELYLLQKWVRTGFRTNRIGSFSHLLGGAALNELDQTLGLTASTATLDDLEKADLIMVFNAELSEENLIAELKIKSALKRGARLVTFGSAENPLAKIADLWIDAKRGANTLVLSGLANWLIKNKLQDSDFIADRTDGFKAFAKSIAPLSPEKVAELSGVSLAKLQKLAELLAKPELNLMLVTNIDSLWEKSGDDLRAAAHLLLLTGRFGRSPGNGLILLRDYANSQGLLDMGVDPRYLPGEVQADASGLDAQKIKKLGQLWKTDLQRTFRPIDLHQELINGKVKAVLVFGEDPLVSPAGVKMLAGIEFLLVLDHFLTATGREADIVLPASFAFESQGTFTSADRRVQRAERIFSSPTGRENWQIIRALAEKINMNLDFASTADIFQEIRAANPYYQKVELGESWGRGLMTKRFPTPSGKARFQPVAIEPAAFNLWKQPLLASENWLNSKIKGKLVI